MDKEAGFGHLLAHGLLLGGGAYAAHRYAKNKRRQEDLKVPLKKVDSSMVRELGYAPRSKTLHARFNTGKRYKYKDVSPKEYKELRDAESVGAHFNTNIKDKYAFEKLSVRNWGALKSFVTGGGKDVAKQTTKKVVEEGAKEGLSWKAKAGIAAAPALIGGGIGATMKDSQGNAGGVGGFMQGAMMGAALPFAGMAIGKGIGKGFGKVKAKVTGKPVTAQGPPGTTATPTQSTPTVQTTQSLSPPTPMSTAVDTTQKVASFNGICLIDEETFEKAASTTLIAQTAAGAGMGALVAGEGNRMQGAALGAGVGLGGAMAGRALGRSSAMNKLTPQLQTKVTNHKAILDAQLKNTKGLSARHDAIEAFMKNPAHAEFAQIYRSQMSGGLAGGVLAGGAAGLMANKTAALRAVDRLNKKYV